MHNNIYAGTLFVRHDNLQLGLKIFFTLKIQNLERENSQSFA